MVKKIWRDPVWSAVIAGAIIAAATYIFGFWPTIWRLLKGIPALFLTPLPIPLWAIVLITPALILAIPVIRSLKSGKEPGFVSYNSDTIFDIKWYWRWLPPGFYSSHYQVQDLTPRCPACHAVLTINDYDGSLVNCINENCQWQWERQRRHGSRISHSSELDSKVRNEIDRRIHSGERG